MKYGDKITVVSLCYENYNLLYETIDSVINQDYCNIEYIISDDGSSRFPVNEIKNYIQLHNKGNIKNIIVRKNETNLGTVKHENIVCNISQGEYIVELSCGDTFVDSTILEKIVKKIIFNNDDLLVFRRLVCDESGKELYYLPHTRVINKLLHMEKNDQYEAFVGGHFWEMASGCAMAYKREFIVNMKFDERYTLLEDYPFFTKYTWENKMNCCYDIVAIRYALGGVSNTPNLIIKKDMNKYNQYDRIEHFNTLSFFAKEKVRYQLLRSKCKFKLYFIVRFPHVMVWLILYKINEKIGAFQDHKILSNKQIY